MNIVLNLKTYIILQITMLEKHLLIVIVTEESYTSGTSFLDKELPTKENYRKERRIFRGLFKTNKGKLINANVNGSLQIMKKVFSNAFNGDEIEVLGLTPIRVVL